MRAVCFSGGGHTGDLPLALCFTKLLGTDGRGQRLLGACYFAPVVAIFVDPSLLSAEEGPRFRFTLAHELGHLSLHRKLTLDFESLGATAKAILDGRGFAARAQKACHAA